ncbi:MAG TPA: DUF1501 domain-containing protein [Steroidobacteraceae bacterium]|nr:DUF1501 domain-containing protein [Steroidobacteraceae bacterium]
MDPLTRRNFLLAGAQGAGLLALSKFSFALPASGSHGDGRFVFILLRGALDGLSAVPPYGDPAYAALREANAIAPPGAAQGGLKLDNTFALHPGLAFLHERYAAGELLVAHAVATAYRERSHFDGQDVLESGMPVPHASASGWLNRALPARKEAGVVLGANLPLVMRGPAPVASWSPTRLASLSEDTLQRITDLYATDALLGPRLADALSSNAIATGSEMTAAATPAPTPGADAMQGAATLGAATPGDGSDASANGAADRSTVVGKRGGVQRYAETVRAAAGFLKREDGPRVAVFDTLGWDTHANEGGAEGLLAQRLAALDAGLRELHDALGPVWNRTAVLLATEFGRTAAINGTRGTDHGTGAAAFLVGGAVAGGRVLCDWPGLSNRALYQGRDLRPTLDLRALIKGVLHEQLQVSDRQLEAEVFPDSGAVRRTEGLIRA